MANDKPGNMRSTITFAFVIILGLIIGILIRRVHLGLLIGLILGLLGSSLIKRRN